MDSGAAPQLISLAGGNRPVIPASVDPTYEVPQAVAESQTSEVPDDEWHSATRPGLVFQLRKMSRMALVEAQDRFQPPKVPMIEIKEDERWEPNPNDPDYRAAMVDYIYQRNVIIINTCLVLGTSIKAYSSDLDKPDDTDWIDQLETTGFSAPTGKWARYAAWARLYALDGQEILDLTNKVQRYNGFTREADVEAAIDTFPSEPPRNTDREDASQEGRGLGDNNRNDDTGSSS